MTLQRSSNSPKGGGRLLKISSGANAGKLQKECCCTDLPSTDYVEFKVCPNCSNSLGSICGCNTNDYNFRTSCTADPGDYRCTAHGFNGVSSCDESDDTGAIYIAVDQLVEEIPTRILWVRNRTGDPNDDTPEYFHTTTAANGNPNPIITLDGNGNATQVQTNVWLRFTDPTSGQEKRGWMRTTGQLRDGDTLTSCQKRNASIIFNNRDCAGNVWLLGSGNPGFDLESGGLGLNCESVCKVTSWARLNPCPGECKCNEPNLEDCYHALGEYAAGLWHLPCNSCSVCNPASSLGKYVADGDTFDVGKGSFHVVDTDVDNPILYQKPKNDLFGQSDFQTQSKCPCNYEGSFQPVTRNGPGNDINCDYECEGSTKESPFESCIKATRLSALDGNGDFICDEDSICTCCCDPGEDHFPNCPTSISISLPEITLSSNSQYALHPAGVFCVEDQADPFNTACGPPFGSNACDCYPDVLSATIPATIQPADGAGTCKYESVFSSGAPLYGLNTASVESVNICEPNFCAGIFGPGTACSASTVYANQVCNPATEFVSGWNGVTLRCTFNSEGINTFVGSARFTVGAFDSTGMQVCTGPSGTVYFEAKNPAGLAQCPADVGPLKISSINPNPGSSPIGGACIDLSQSLPKNVTIQ